MLSFRSVVEKSCKKWNEDGTPTARTGKILAATPMSRFGETEEIIGATLFLISEEAAGFITGVVLPIDGGFSAYRTPTLEKCTASHCVKLEIAAFAAEYAGILVSGVNAFIEEIFRILQPPRKIWANATSL